MTLEVAAELGDAPVLVMGDLNVDPGSSLVLRAAVASGCWHDAAAEKALALGEPAPCTCFARGSAGTRIDAIFCNAAVAPALRDVAVIEDTGIPTHVPVVVDLAVETYGQRVRRLARPMSFDPSGWAKWTPEAELSAALAVQQSRRGCW